jgi:hypothetical protein
MFILERKDPMDEMDRVQDAVDEMRAYFIESVRAHRPTLPPTGECFYCGKPLGGGLRWCDAECRDEWERAQASRGVRR